ncbi:ABC transporter substrate-binding protein [Parabacteroides sp. FAFU027]|uniref:ABC transporter substrate-binding protein n=1 Tax=Parabacteroides sp. FAFU027 TaxID=2922715 RepID=UPI001FAE889D|nr:ABC transporter substrate-binding protein [Parabacteroides sp. FAFU027]
MNTLYTAANNQPEIWEELLSEIDIPVQIPTDDLSSRIFTTATCLRSFGVSPEKLSIARKIARMEENAATDNGKPFMVALLPCGMRNAFKEAFFEKFPQYADDDEQVVIDGNLNFEKQFYSYLDHIGSTEELPDILITSDINNLYYRDFMYKFLLHEGFDRLNYPVYDYFSDMNPDHPQGAMKMISSNMLVMVINQKHYSTSAKPQEWYEILDKKLEKKLVLRGDKDFFCNAVLYPFYKEYGDEALRVLGKNTLKGMHPAEMVREINTKKENDVAVYVMPYSFACKVRNVNFTTVWPKDGAIVSPVQILVKRGKAAQHKELLDFIFGKIMGEQLEQNGFPSFHADTIKRYPGRKLKWVGWNFFIENDLQEVKMKMQEAFMESFHSSGIYLR